MNYSITRPTKYVAVVAGAIALSALLMFAATAFAGVGVSVTPNFPSSVTVGDTNLPVSLSITNNSDGGDGDPLTLTSIRLTPSCGDIAGGVCTNPDPGVFTVDVSGTGLNACAANTFTIAETNVGTGEVTLTPNAPIALSPGQNCTINFTVDVVGAPDVDATVAAGMQTLQLGNVAGTDQLQQPGTGSGSDTTTVIQMGNIIVDKVTDPSGDPQSFSFDASGGSYQDFALTDAAAPNNQSLVPGAYSVSETVPAGWDLTSATCVSSMQDVETPAALELDAGETITCTFNNQKDANIIIVKQTTPDGSLQSFEFDTNYGNNFNLTDGQQNDSGDLAPGTYSAAEINMPAGWTLASSSCSDQSAVGSISLQAGETVTCTFNNVLQQGRIVVDKVTNPSGDTQSFAFTTTGTGYNGFSLTDAAAPNDQTLNAGTYAVSETVPAGWTLASSTCVSSIQDIETAASLELDAGEVITCTFNNVKESRIITDKVTNPSGDTTSFTFNTTGAGFSGFSLTDTAAVNNQVLAAGTYTITEASTTGWTLTSAMCSVNGGTATAYAPGSNLTLNAGDTITCTFTNTKDEVQYCSPGYWKQSQHFDSWVGYTPNQTFESVFGESITIMWSSKGKPKAVANPTLLQVLEGNGGGVTSLARAAVGALLNSTSMNSGFTSAQIISIFQDANPSGDFEAAKAQFNQPHNCPLN